MHINCYGTIQKSKKFNYSPWRFPFFENAWEVDIMFRIRRYIFQAGICSTGSQNRVLAGSQYNRCWSVHGILAESLEMLLFERFIVDHETQSEILSEHFKYKEVT